MNPQIEEFIKSAYQLGNEILQKENRTDIEEKFLHCLDELGETIFKMI